MKPQLLLLLCLLGCSFHANGDESENNGADIIDKGTFAVLTKSVAPVYPERALKRGVEGWVIVGFLIKADGTTDEIEVLDSSIEGYFDEAAIEATRARTYRPATISGEPVGERNKSVRYTFTFQDSKGDVSRRFLSAYEKASKAIDDDDLPRAKKLIDKLDEDNKRLLAEVCYLDMLKARYFASIGDDKSTLKHVERALTIADVVASTDIYVNLLKQGIVDNAKVNNFQASIEYYEKLMEIENGVKADDPINGLVLRIKQVLDGPNSIQFSGELARSSRTREGRYYWHYRLNRNRFLIDQVNGSLDEIEIDCQFSNVWFAYVPETQWSVNRDSGDCWIYVFGKQGTTFRIVELPRESS